MDQRRKSPDRGRREAGLESQMRVRFDVAELDRFFDAFVPLEIPGAETPELAVVTCAAPARGARRPGR